jgi:hypothetical protein
MRKTHMTKETDVQSADWRYLNDKRKEEELFLDQKISTFRFASRAFDPFLF